MPSRIYHLVLFVLVSLLQSPVRAEVIVKSQGLDEAIIENALAHLSLSKEPCDAPAWRIRREFRRIEEEIQSGLRVFGYYQAVINKKLSQEASCWRVSVDIDAGDPVRVDEIELEITGDAAEDPEFKGYRETFSIAKGDVLNHQKYDAEKTRLRNLAAERGYFDASLTKHQLVVNPHTNLATIRLAMDSGQRYSIGEINFSEQPLDNDFLRRLANIETGSAYNAQKLIALDRRLSDSGYYRSVNVYSLRDQAVEGEVPIDIQLEAKARHAWRTGIGFATDTSVRLTGGYENRFINKKGHRFDAELLLSPVESSLTSNYLIPGKNPHKENYNLGFSLLHEDTDSRLSDSVSLVARQTLKRDVWTHNRGLSFLFEEYTVSGETDTAWMLMPEIGWTHQQADDPLKVTRGYRVSLNLKGAYEGFLSTASFIQARSFFKGIYRFGQAGRISGRAEIGLTLDDAFHDMPASLRFYAGGDNSVRGYAYESLGPKDSSGEVIGGENLLTMSLEYEHPVVGDEWWGAAFVDAGNAFDFDNNPIALKYAYGIGARWYSPIGKLRLDVAIPEDTSEDNWRIHFAFGADL